MDTMFYLSDSDLAQLADVALTNCDIKKLNDIRCIQQTREKERFSQLQMMRSENSLNPKNSV